MRANSMKAMIATISTLVTLIGAILVGGFNFGEIRGQTNGNVEQIKSIDNRLSSVESNINELTRLTTEIATNMMWIRQSIQVSKLEREVKDGVVAIIEDTPQEASGSSSVDDSEWMGL